MPVNVMSSPMDAVMSSVMEGVFSSGGDTSAQLQANLLEIAALIGAAPTSDPWQNAEYVGATVTPQDGGSATGYAANGAAHPNNPKRWTTTPNEILWDGGLDATTGTNYHDALTGMVSAGVINRCWNRASVPACSTRKIAIRLLGTGSPTVLIQLGNKFVAKAGHALAGSSGLQWLFVDRGAGFDANERITVWSTGGIDGFYPETGGVITPEPAPWNAKAIVFNGDSITDSGGPSLVYNGFAAQVAWRLGFKKCIANGVTGTGYVADSGGQLYYTVGQRVPNMTGASNGEMIAAGATNRSNMLLGCFVAGVNDLISGISASAVGAACRAAIEQFQRDAPGVPLIVFDSWDRNAPSAPESGYAAQSAAIQAACAGFVGVKFKSLQALAYSKMDPSHPDDPGAVQQTNGVVALIGAAIDEMLLDLNVPIYPTAFLGRDLLALWDADRADLVTRSSNLVSSWKDVVGGYDLVQAIGAAKPTYSPDNFNAHAAVGGDGVDDELTGSVPASFPVNADAGEVWTLGDQKAPAPTDTGTRYSVSYGGDAVATTRGMRRLGSSSATRAGIISGDGTTAFQSNRTSPPAFFGRQVQRGIFTPTTIATELDGSASTPVAVVSATQNTRLRFFAAATLAPASYGQIDLNMVAFTKPLSATRAALLTRFLNSRKAA